MAKEEAVIQPSEAPSEDDAAAQAAFDEGASEGTTKPAPLIEGERPRDESGRFAPADDKTAKPAAKTDAKPADKGKPAKTDAKADAKTDAKPEVKTDAQPEYVQITKEQFAKFESAVAAAEKFEQQFSKVFGTVGDMQKILRGLQSQTPKGVAVKLPPGAFDKMKKDFPELAEHMQTAMEEILKGAEGTGAAGSQVDPQEFEQKLEERVRKIADEDLSDEFPNWKEIVGAVDASKGEKPDPNNAFRKWLTTKPQEYQDRINSTNSAGVITRAIRLFRSDEKKAAAGAPPAKPNGKDQTRANRIADAVRPKGDGGHPPGSDAEDDFEAGFKTG